MPARSTPFQKLVAQLQVQLSPGHEVLESAMLRHRLTNTDREVDVVIRALVGEHPLVVSVECVDQARPADATWVEQMKAKHEHLETNRLVLVSRAGFYQPAIRLADGLGIATYTPDDACSQDWTTIVGRGPIFVARFDFTPIARWVRLQTSTEDQLVEAGDPTQLVRADRSLAGTLGELVMALLNGREFATPAMDRLPADMTTTLQLDCNVDDEIYALDTSDRAHRVTGLRVKLKAVRRTSQLDLTSMTWKGTPAAFGHDQTVLGETTITFVESGPGQLDAQVIVDGKELQVYNHGQLTVRLKDPKGQEG